MLNALRHQWFRHTVGATIGGALTVLNALRHQWFRHFQKTLEHADHIRCSTPYGINGFGTFEYMCPSSAAIRAQRLTASMVSAPSIQPSRVWSMTSAQRLTASMVSAHTFEGNRQRHPRVLNALRHQWFRHFNYML